MLPMRSRTWVWRELNKDRSLYSTCSGSMLRVAVGVSDISFKSVSHSQPRAITAPGVVDVWPVAELATRDV